MHNLVLFVGAVVSHWLALAGGAAAIVLLGLYERYSGANIPAAAYTALLISFVIFAAFLAWEDERKRAATALERMEPKISGNSLHTTIVNRQQDNLAMAVIYVALKNEGADSIVDNIVVSYELGNGQLLNLPTIGFTNDVKLFDGTVIKPSDIIYDKVSERPIVRGGKVVGIVAGVFPAGTKTADVAVEGRRFRIGCVDVNGRPIEFWTEPIKLAAKPYTQMRLAGFKSVIGEGTSTPEPPKPPERRNRRNRNRR